MSGPRRPPRLQPRERRSARRVDRPGRDTRAAALHLVSDGDRPDAGRTAPPRRGSGHEASPSVQLAVVRGGADRGADSSVDEHAEGRTKPRPKARSERHSHDRVRNRRRHPRGQPLERARDGRPRRKIGLGIAFAVALAAVALMIIAQPLGQWRSQQKDIAEAQEKLEDVKEQRRLIREQTEDMSSEAAVRRYARSMFEMVDPGEDLVIVLPSGVEDLGLPDTWPFTGVERELGTG